MRCLIDPAGGFLPRRASSGVPGAQTREGMKQRGLLAYAGREPGGHCREYEPLEKGKDADAGAGKGRHQVGVCPALPETDVDLLTERGVGRSEERERRQMTRGRLPQPGGPSRCDADDGGATEKDRHVSQRAVKPIPRHGVHTRPAVVVKRRLQPLPVPVEEKPEDGEPKEASKLGETERRRVLSLWGRSGRPIHRHDNQHTSAE